MGYLDPPDYPEPMDHYDISYELFGLDIDDEHDPLMNTTGTFLCEICPRKHRCRDSSIQSARDSEIEARYWFKESIVRKYDNWLDERRLMQGIDLDTGLYVHSPEHEEWVKEETEKAMAHIDSGRADFEYDVYKERQTMRRF